MKVVVQVSDYGSLAKAIRPVNNLKNEIPDAQIEVVIHQDAIRGLISRGLRLWLAGTA